MFRKENVSLFTLLTGPSNGSQALRTIQIDVHEKHVCFSLFKFNLINPGGVQIQSKNDLKRHETIGQNACTLSDVLYLLTLKPSDHDYSLTEAEKRAETISELYFLARTSRSMTRINIACASLIVVKLLETEKRTIIVT